MSPARRTAPVEPMSDGELTAERDDYCRVHGGITCGRGEGQHAVCKTVRRLLATIAALQAERDAYRKAKQENDERFMNERDEARARVAQIEAALRKIADDNEVRDNRVTEIARDALKETP